MEERQFPVFIDGEEIGKIILKEKKKEEEPEEEETPEE